MLLLFSAVCKKSGYPEFIIIGKKSTPNSTVGTITHGQHQSMSFSKTYQSRGHTACFSANIKNRQ
jgi:hypothetical protein